MYGGSDLQAKEYHLLKILVCRRHYAHIDSSCLRTPKPFEFLLLNRTQELGLKLERQIADFVEKKGAAIRRLKMPYSVSHRTCKGTSLMSKQFALQQGGGYGRTIDCHKPALPAWAGVMNRSGDYFLARTRLSPDEHGTANRRHGLNVFKYSPELRARSN
jgi:hypothetical protein